MWAWRKKEQEEHPTRGAARVALSGGSREELMREVIHSVALDGRADRIGVWLEQDMPAIADGNSPEILRGLVWEANEESAPAEWEKLSLEPPLPLELLASGKSVHLELDSSAARPLIGPLIGLHQALWTPIQAKGRLCGVLLTGSQRTQTALPRDRVESVAAELALALELEHEQRVGRERQTDLRLNKQILAAFASGASTDTVLSQIAASCTEAFGDGSSPRVSFAVIGQLPPSQGADKPLEMEFAWESGDPAWAHSIEREPLASLWREALKAGRVMGTEAPASSSKSGLERLVAIPLAGAEQKLGVLVAGIPHNSSSLNILERLEFRAALAVSALERRKSNSEKIRRVVRRQALFELSPEPTLLLDAQGAIAHLNRAAKAILEEPRGQRWHERASSEEPQPASGEAVWFVGGRLSQLFCAREQDRVEEWSRRALAIEQDRSQDLPENCEADLINGVRVRLHSPVAVGDDLAAVVLESTPAHEAAVQRSRSEAELHNVLEWVEEGILVFGANHSLRAMNTRFAQIAGLSAEEASACLTLENLVEKLAERAAEPESFAKRWRELARRNEGGIREEIPLARPVPRVLERSMRPVFDQMGRRLGRIEIYRDLTAQRVFQAKLLQTEKLAALGQMITGVAHELSNPLTSILGYSQRLLVRNDLAGRTEEARQIYQEAERASAILRQLLLGARENQSERKRVALNQVVQKAMELQRFGSAAEKIRMELDLDPALPFILGDPGQLQQVLMNLIGNARQAIAHEGKAGTIRLRTARAGERSVLLQVIDDGPGIPQTILSRIFDPFFTTKPAGIGTGLGLSIVLSVVREHGGHVNVSPSPGGGATFTVELPVAAEASAESAPLQIASREKRSSALPVAAGAKGRAHPLHQVNARASHRGSKVLVVEDEPTVARLIADVLEDDGLQVDVLLDGREALSRAAREPYDLVICDMKMPGLDGQNFYQSLARAHSPLQERFLFVTGDVLAPQTQEFLRRNRIPHVAKPFRVEELTGKIYTLLDSQLTRSGRAAAARKAH